MTENIDDSAPEKLLENIMASLAQFDNDVKSERTTEGMIAALQSGRWTFQAPTSYQISRGNKDGPSLEADPDHGPLVAELFEMIASHGFSSQDALDRVTALGLRTCRGKKVSRQTLSKILSNPIYTGLIRVPKMENRVSGRLCSSS